MFLGASAFPRHPNGIWDRAKSLSLKYVYTDSDIACDYMVEINVQQ